MNLQLADGGNLYYEIHGDRGSWLVFLNGAMSTTATWAGQVPLISPHHRLLLVDFRDQGRSSRLAPGYPAARHGDDLIELFDRLGLPQVDLLGVSYGGQVAMTLARRHPRRLRRLVLASITPRPSAHLRAVGAAWEAVAAHRDGAAFFAACNPLVFSRRYHEQNGGALQVRQRALVSLLDDAWFAAFLRISSSAREFDHRGELEEITAPTLLLCGSDDALTPPDEVFAMADRIPDCTALAIPGAGHGLMLEQPRAFAAAVLGFLALEP
jgi:pimeloyl-ACP methyl ester carboxylesterase